MKINVAIYETDKVYRERFADYLMSYKSHELELSVFSEKAYFSKGVREGKYQLLVLGCGYEEVLPQVRGISVPVLVLTEYSQCYVRETPGVEEQITYIPKYQSMDTITSQMQKMVHKVGRAELMIRTMDLEVVGVVSPIHHEMQMFFSLLYAKNLAKRERVLYINLLEMSGFGELFGETDYHLEDVVLLLREGDASPELLRECIYEMDGIAYISPLKSVDSIKEITDEDIKHLLEFVEKYTDYSKVILDVGNAVTGLAGILVLSTKIYCLTKQGYYFDMQKKQLFDYLLKKIDATFLERIKTLELPYQAKGILDSVGLLEQLEWSEFGVFVRERSGVIEWRRNISDN